LAQRCEREWPPDSFAHFPAIEGDRAFCRTVSRSHRTAGAQSAMTAHADGIKPLGAVGRR